MYVDTSTANWPLRALQLGIPTHSALRTC